MKILTSRLINRTLLTLALCAAFSTAALGQSAATPEIRTPKPPATPRINGPGIFGVRPGHPFLYHIPATGERPMSFSVDNLPPGLKLDPATGDLSGSLNEKAEHTVTLRAKNAKGAAEKKFRIVVGETLALTPPMGWNSWNHYSSRISAEIVLANAKAMANSGLINHGWTYLNIDDTWQGKRGGPLNALQGNEKFPDMKGLCDAVHALGLKIGIYSTPWVTSYARHTGGSAENPEGTWERPTGPKQPNRKILPWAIGKYSFATNDAKQWAAWGIDYLKYDWNPNEEPETREMYNALRSSGRDVVFSLSNNTPFTNAPALTQYANCWRTSGDIKANWQSMSSKGFGEDRWLPFCRPGHWNDPDMLEVGTREKGQPGLTPDEEYTHITLWCLVSAPLLLGNDLSQLDAFTLSLLSNDEVLAVNQDSLGRQAATIVHDGDRRVLAKELEDGSKAVGLFNTGTNGPVKVTIKWSDLKLVGPQTVRDLWRQKDLGRFKDQFELTIPPHGAEMIKISAR
ncbi:MAG: putative Ig domain-containing protein [Verrucomicrobiota bacterium]